MFGKRLSRALALTVTFTLVMAVNVFADTVDNDVTAAASTFTYVIGGNAQSVSYSVAQNPQGTDPQSGCNATDGSALTVTINVPAGVTASPSSLIFTACGNLAAQNVDFTATTPGSYSITHTLSDSGTGTYTNSANFTLEVLTNPLAVAVSPASNGDNGWYDSGTISVDWTVFAGPPAPSDVSGCTDFTISADQVKTNYTCQATYGGEYGGQTFSVSTGLLGLDTTAPSVAITSPADDSSTGSSSITVSGTASDATSGLAEVKVNGTAVTVSSGGWSTSVSLSCGSNLITADAKDNAGNTNSASINVNRGCYTTNGFFQPVDMNNVVNKAKAGQTIPLKFDIIDGNGDPVADNTGLVGIVSKVYTCGSLDSGGTDIIETYSTSDAGLRWDATAQQYVFNFATQKSWAGACRSVTLYLDGGEAAVAYFQFVVK
jgi:hypothetical protein